MAIQFAKMQQRLQGKIRIWQLTCEHTKGGGLASTIHTQ